MHAEAFYMYSNSIYFKSWDKLVFAVRLEVIFKIQNEKCSLMVSKDDKFYLNNSVFSIPM